MLLFDVVFIPTGEGACARPGGSAYPHYCSLLTRVDSAEADKVGNQRLRFCAYVGLAVDEGVRHYRATRRVDFLFLSSVRSTTCFSSVTGMPHGASSLDGVGDWLY